MNELEKDYVERFRHYVRLYGIVSEVHEDLILEYRNKGITIQTAVILYLEIINKAKPRP